MVTRHDMSAGKGPLVLIVEDEAEIADIVAAYLERNGFRHAHAGDGVQGLDLHHSLNPDLVLLDIQLPREDGWSVLNKIRARGETPVIMLTARDEDIDKLMGLRLGADDYVIKPFNPAEVVARVQAVLRRAHAGHQRKNPEPRCVGPFQINMENHEISVFHQQEWTVLALTLTEFNLLAHMIRAPRRVFSREELITACLPENDALERTVDSHVSKLRKKLAAVGLDNMPTSIRGVGYRLGDL